jgi:two-component system nitrate/nitrite sensor histidine kinase NarX
MPLQVRNRVIGILSLLHVEPDHYAPSTQNLIKLFANQLAIAIENARLYAQAQETATLDERSRLARELHDAVTQTLFSASLIAETLPRAWEQSPEKAQHGLEELRRLTRGALAEMRAMLLELRPTILAEQGLDGLLRQLAEAMLARTHVPITTTVVGDCELPVEVKLNLYRIAQEALHNVAKHAQAGQVKVYLHCQPGRVRLRISDDGCGLDPAAVGPGKLGIGIMRERAQTIGADFTLESQPGQGTKITVTWEDTPGTGDASQNTDHASRRGGEL